MTHSILDEIEGVGEKRRIELMKHFKTIEGIRDASVEALQEVSGINARVAQSIYDYFRTPDSEVYNNLDGENTNKD